MKLKAILVMVLIVVIMTPTLILGFTVTPWIFLGLFALLLIFPMLLAPRVDKQTGDTKNAEFLVRLIFGVTLVFGGFVCHRPHRRPRIFPVDATGLCAVALARLSPGILTRLG